MHVLLVGASGFIGKCLAPYLIADGFEVSTLSRNPVACSGLFKQFIFPDFSRAPLGNCFSNIDVVVNLADLLILLTQANIVLTITAFQMSYC